MAKQLEFYDMDTGTKIVVDVDTEDRLIEFYDSDSKKLIIFDPENNQMILNVEMLGGEAPWLEGSNYTNRYIFRELCAVETIMVECAHLDTWDQFEELLKKHPYDYEQIAVDI